MGAPTSAILSEIFLQSLEQNHILKLLNKYLTIGYFQYVDDILIIHSTQTIQTENKFTKFKSLHPQLRFKLEISNSINYLYLTIIRNLNWNTEFNVYRRPSAIGLIIQINCCHPLQHNKNDRNYLVNWMNIYPISDHGRKRTSNNQWHSQE
jgi:hypothetical protein